MTNKQQIPNILTVDVEDWFHICGVNHYLSRSDWNQLESRVVPNTLHLLELFDRFRTKATFFMLGWIARHHPDLVREIAQRGHEIATHGYNHQRVYTLSPQLFQQDLERSLEILTPLCPEPVQGFRAPQWSIRNDSLWALDILAQAGLHYDASMAPLHFIGHPDNPRSPYRHTTAYGNLWELPPLVGSTPLVNLPIGGGWGLRIFPYTLIKFFVRQLNRQKYPAIFFIHPREMDNRTPKTDLPLAKHFVLCARVVHTQTRLHQLLRDFHFITIADYLRTRK